MLPNSSNKFQGRGQRDQSKIESPLVGGNNTHQMNEDVADLYLTTSLAIKNNLKQSFCIQLDKTEHFLAWVPSPNTICFKKSFTLTSPNLSPNTICYTNRYFLFLSFTFFPSVARKSGSLFPLYFVFFPTNGLLTNSARFAFILAKKLYTAETGLETLPKNFHRCVIGRKGPPDNFL